MTIFVQEPLKYGEWWFTILITVKRQGDIDYTQEHEQWVEFCIWRVLMIMQYLLLCQFNVKANIKARNTPVFWFLLPAVQNKFTDVSETLSASIIRTINDDGGSQHI